MARRASEVAFRLLENIRTPDHNHNHRQPLKQSTQIVEAIGTGVFIK
jgi:hypothetical protein